MRVHFSASSDPGCIRPRNEDTVVVGADYFTNNAVERSVDCTASTPPFWLAVLDGLGGHQAGDRASSIVAREIIQLAATLQPNQTTEALKGQLEQSLTILHRELNRQGLYHPQWTGMGTTLAGLLFYESRMVVVNCGDSRVYRYRSGVLAPITRDHSRQVMSGNPDVPINVLANSLGGGVEGVFFDIEEITHRISPTDVVLLCTDGLTTELSDEAISGLLASHGMAELLVEAAKYAGGADNISAILAFIHEE